MNNNETPLRTSQNFLLDSDALTKLQNNDPTLTSLTVGIDSHYYDMDNTDGFLPHYNDWGKCGQIIGRNTHLVKLSFGQSHGIMFGNDREMDEDMCMGIVSKPKEPNEKQFRDFCNGLAMNRSIKELSFVSSLPPLIEGEQRGVTDGFGLAYTLMSDWLGNNSVEKLTMPWCDGECIQDNSGENRKLARALSSFNSLKHFVIEFTGDYRMGNYNDNTCEVANQIIDSLSKHPNLETVRFTFTKTSLGSSGYTSLSRLLADSKIKVLRLEGGLTGEGAVALSAMLEGNQTLEELILDDSNSRLSTAGCKAFLRLLLGNDSGSIMDTFNSNHTLQRLFSSDFRFTDSAGRWQLPDDLQLALHINTLCNKADAARFKIILGHNFTKGDFSPEPFDDMDLSVMPHVLAWMGRSNADVAPLYRFADADLCLMFKFVRGMAPTLFDSPASVSAGKRKLQQM